MVKVNKDICIGCGLCEAICPEVFRLNEEGKSEVISDKDCECIRDAIEGCPVEAISE